MAIKEILDSEIKPKEKTALIAESIKKDEKLIEELIQILRTGSDVEKGNCADVLKHVTKDRPDIVVPYMDVLVGYINHRVLRVMWGVPESIGNMAQKYPEEAGKAVPRLLLNTKHESIVVRWCAAYALTQIAKHNQKIREELEPKFKDIVKTEKNNGVRNVYLKGA